MDWFRALQQFNADLPDGSQRTVILGETLPGNHELVKRDLAGAAAAAKAGIDRAPLFEQLDTSDEKTPDKAPSSRARKAASS